MSPSEFIAHSSTPPHAFVRCRPGRKRVAKAINAACMVAMLIGAVLLRFRHETLGWFLWAASAFTLASLTLYLVVARRRGPLWPRGDGAPRCTKCRYPIEADYAVCPECGLALTPEKVEASRFVWMDRRLLTILLAMAALGFGGGFLALGMMLRAM